MKTLIVVLVILLCLGVCGCYRQDYVVGVQGHIVERDWIEIDSVRTEYWGKLVILTDHGDRVTLNVDLYTYYKLADYSYISIRFQRNGEIRDYVYGRERCQ